MNPHNAYEIVYEVFKDTKNYFAPSIWRGDVVEGCFIRRRGYKEYRLFRSYAPAEPSRVVLECVDHEKDTYLRISEPDIHISELPWWKFLRFLYHFFNISHPPKWDCPQTEEEFEDEKLRIAMEDLYNLVERGRLIERGGIT